MCIPIIDGYHFNLANAHFAPTGVGICTVGEGLVLGWLSKSEITRPINLFIVSLGKKARKHFFQNSTEDIRMLLNKIERSNDIFLEMLGALWVRGYEEATGPLRLSGLVLILTSPRTADIGKIGPPL